MVSAAIRPTHRPAPEPAPLNTALPITGPSITGPSIPALLTAVLTALLLLLTAARAYADVTAADRRPADGTRISGTAADPGAVRTLVVGVEDLDYLPYYGTVRRRSGSTAEDGAGADGAGADGAGEMDGAFRDILDAFGAERGYRFIYRPMPIRRLFAALERGDIDLKFPENPVWGHPEKRRLPMIYGRPLLRATDAAFVPADRAGRPMATVRRLGHILGFDLPFWTDRPDPPEQVEVQTVDSLVRIALAGRVDAIHANTAVVAEVMRRLGADGALVRDPTLPAVDYDYHLGTTRHGPLLRELDEWIAANPDRITEITRRRRVEGPVG